MHEHLLEVALSQLESFLQILILLSDRLQPLLEFFLLPLYPANLVLEIHGVLSFSVRPYFLDRRQVWKRLASLFLVNLIIQEILVEFAQARCIAGLQHFFIQYNLSNQPFDNSVERIGMDTEVVVAVGRQRLVIKQYVVVLDHRRIVHLIVLLPDQQAELLVAHLQPRHLVLHVGSEVPSYLIIPLEIALPEVALPAKSFFEQSLLLFKTHLRFDRRQTDAHSLLFNLVLRHIEVRDRVLTYQRLLEPLLLGRCLDGEREWHLLGKVDVLHLRLFSLDRERVDVLRQDSL